MYVHIYYDVIDKAVAWCLECKIYGGQYIGIKIV